MITIGKVRNADYYLHELHQDDAFTYYGSLERSGRWHGALAEELALEGLIDPDGFRAILNGVRPDTGTSLTAFPIKVRALDATLSVSKSVSVLWAVGDVGTQRSIEVALDRAEAAVVRLLESEATVVRRGHAGLDYHAGRGLIVASFDHRTSRLGDPNLHRHLIVANASRGPDDRITGIDTRQLYQIRYTAEAVFQAELRRELALSLGVMFGETDRHGVGEVAGIPTSVRREFSQRRRDIEAEMTDRGVSTGRGARIAALATRPAKADQPPDEVLRVEWRERARRAGFDPRQIHTLGDRNPGPHVSDAEIAAAVTEQHATHTRRDVIRTIARLSHDGATLEAVLARTDRYLAGPHAIERVPDTFTTPEILELETRSVTRAIDSLVSGVGVTSPGAVQAALAARPHLAMEQRQMVERSASAGDGVTVVVGKAGAGKTTALDALRASNCQMLWMRSDRQAATDSSGLG